MKAAIVALCLLGSGGLWAWAYWAPKALAPLDDKYVGQFELFQFEPGYPNNFSSPLDGNKRWIYWFSADHTYKSRTLVGAGYEMARDDFLILTQVTANGAEESTPPSRYYVRWGSDEKGPYLNLTHDVEDRPGDQLFLRRVEE
jgi:hypothetical protein